MRASWASDGSCSWYLSRNASKLQRGPSCDSSTPSTSKGIAPVSCATRATSLGGTNRNSASLSIKRSMSHGHAIRSIFGLSLVTHFIVTSTSELSAVRSRRSLFRSLAAECSVQIVEQGRPLFDAIFVVRTERGDPRDHSCEPRSFFTAKLGVFTIDVVDYLGNLTERAVVRNELGDECLEAACVTHVRVLRLEHVEPKLAIAMRIPVWLDEPEGRAPINEPTNEPCTRDAVDVNIPARYPGLAVHRRVALPFAGLG